MNRSLVTRRAVIAVLLSAALLGACGDSDDETASTTSAPGDTTSTSAATSGAITDAPQTRDDLLAAAKTALQGKDVKADNRGATTAVADAWKARLPGATISGYSVEPKPGPPAAVSSSLVGGITTVNDKDVAGPGNPYRIAFVVKDSAGKCAGGALTGFPTPTQEKKFDLPGPACALSNVTSAML